jgi:hypothetical protein
LRPTATNTGGGRVVPGRFAQQIGVERAAEAFVGADHDHPALAHLAFFHEGMGEVFRAVGRVVHDQGGKLGERPAANGGLLGRCIFDEATICMAFVIWAVF